MLHISKMLLYDTIIKFVIADVNWIFVVAASHRKGIIAMPNAHIKEMLNKNRVYHWEVAKRLGVSEMTLFRWLRQDLPDEKRQQILKAISEIVAERTNN